MKLSDAMVTGRVLRRHVTHFSHRPADGCALQIALAALGMDGGLSGLAKLNIESAYPWMRVADVECPVCPEKWHFSAADMIVHLNDTHEWNLDRIIDFVRSIEPNEEEKHE